MVPCDKQLRECVSVNKLKGQQLVVCVCQAYVYANLRWAGRVWIADGSVFTSKE